MFSVCQAQEHYALEELKSGRTCRMKALWRYSGPSLQEAGLAQVLSAILAYSVGVRLDCLASFNYLPNSTLNSHIVLVRGFDLGRKGEVTALASWLLSDALHLFLVWFKRPQTRKVYAAVRSPLSPRLASPAGSNRSVQLGTATHRHVPLSCFTEQPRCMCSHQFWSSQYFFLKFDFLARRRCLFMPKNRTAQY